MVVDKYNQSMNDVDLADQYTVYCLYGDLKNGGEKYVFGF